MNLNPAKIKGNNIINIKNAKIKLEPSEYIQHQGETKKVKISREGKILELEIRYPLIPDHPDIEENKPEEEKKFNI